MRGVAQSLPAPPEGLHERMIRDEVHVASTDNSYEEFYSKRSREIGLEVNVGWRECYAKMGRITACLRAGGHDPFEKEALTMQELHPCVGDREWLPAAKEMGSFIRVPQCSRTAPEQRPKLVGTNDGNRGGGSGCTDQLSLQSSCFLSDFKSKIIVFIAALFTIAKAWKQQKCPSVGEWLNKL